jgi:hypothetical protein
LQSCQPVALALAAAAAGSCGAGKASGGGRFLSIVSVLDAKKGQRDY